MRLKLNQLSLPESNSDYPCVYCLVPSASNVKVAIQTHCGAGKCDCHAFTEKRVPQKMKEINVPRWLISEALLLHLEVGRICCSGEDLVLPVLCAASGRGQRAQRVMASRFLRAPLRKEGEICACYVTGRARKFKSCSPIFTHSLLFFLRSFSLHTSVRISLHLVFSSAFI